MGELGNISVTASSFDIPDNLQKIIREINKLKKERFLTNPDYVKRQLVEAARGGDKSERVAKLLESPEARKALEQALDKVL